MVHLHRFEAYENSALHAPPIVSKPNLAPAPRPILAVEVFVAVSAYERAPVLELAFACAVLIDLCGARHGFRRLVVPLQPFRFSEGPRRLC